MGFAAKLKGCNHQPALKGSFSSTEVRLCGVREISYCLIWSRQLSQCSHLGESARNSDGERGEQLIRVRSTGEWICTIKNKLKSRTFQIKISFLSQSETPVRSRMEKLFALNISTAVFCLLKTGSTHTHTCITFSISTHWPLHSHHPSWTSSRFLSAHNHSFPPPTLHLKQLQFDRLQFNGDLVKSKARLDLVFSFPPIFSVLLLCVCTEAYDSELLNTDKSSTLRETCLGTPLIWILPSVDSSELKRMLECQVTHASTHLHTHWTFHGWTSWF